MTYHAGWPQLLSEVHKDVVSRKYRASANTAGTVNPFKFRRTLSMMHMYVCARVYRYVCGCACGRVYLYTYAYVCACVSLYIHACVCVCVCVQVYV
jgi:hypothetical protein